VSKGENIDFRSLTLDELKGKVKQLRDELFRFKFKAQTAENRDTSLPRKAKRNIARCLTAIREKQVAEKGSNP